KACSPPTRSKSPSACSSTACGRLGSASGASRHRYRSYCAPVRLPDALAEFREFHHGLLRVPSRLTCCQAADDGRNWSSSPSLRLGWLLVLLTRVVIGAGIAASYDACPK